MLVKALIILGVELIALAVVVTGCNGGLAALRHHQQMHLDCCGLGEGSEITGLDNGPANN